MQHHDAVVEHACARIDVQERSEPIEDDPRRRDHPAQVGFDGQLGGEEAFGAEFGDGVSAAYEAEPEIGSADEVAMPVALGGDGADHFVGRRACLPRQVSS